MYRLNCGTILLRLHYYNQPSAILLKVWLQPTELNMKFSRSWSKQTRSSPFDKDWLVSFPIFSGFFSRIGQSFKVFSLKSRAGRFQTKLPWFMSFPENSIYYIVSFSWALTYSMAQNNNYPSSVYQFISLSVYHFFKFVFMQRR